MWIINSTAVQGRGHIKENIPCQDKVYTKSTENITVIALADGAGSARLSHIGAEVCVQTISNCFIERFDELYKMDSIDDLKLDIYNCLMNSIEQTSIMYNCSKKELACTLLCVAVDNERMISFHLGDGIIAYMQNNEIGIFSFPDNGEFVNITYFITSSSALEHIRIQKIDHLTIDGFFLISDGAGASLYNSQQKKISNALKRISDLSIMNSEKDVHDEITIFFEQCIRTKTLDDCSIAFITRNKPIVSAFRDMPYNEQLTMLKINQKDIHKKKRYHIFLTMMDLFEMERSINYISKQIHLKTKYCAKYIRVLNESGLIKKVRNNVYVNSNFFVD